ncbi:MAG: hypothetical protein IKL53_03120 [Lachnospiraceae bacterium]|nr:hypothetical protein [Lachnospiraceae bacterium]
MKKANLVSVPTLVESPFIVVTIGGYTFGSYIEGGQYNLNGIHSNVDFPNYMKSLEITKVNGTVNSYTLVFEYHVEYGQDPNLLDKVFSSASADRRIVLSYGDWNAPNDIYKEETGIITNVTSNLDTAAAVITYTVNCVSDAIGLTSTAFNFPAKEAKPSDVLLDMVNNARYGLKQVFTGMNNLDLVKSMGLIASTDKTVQLLAQTMATPLEYMNYLVSNMIPKGTDQTKGLSSSKYFLSIHDDVMNKYGGTYFKVTEVSAKQKTVNSTDTYELDVNFPTDNFITQFSLTNDQSWAILYDYSQKLDQQTYSYKVNNEGKVVRQYAPSIMKSSVTNAISNGEYTWWSNMTSFPIEATITLKGLTRPSILMTYVKLNVWFSGGQKHVSSGTYIITKQVDKIDSNGYTTTLTLLRVGGD